MFLDSTTAKQAGYKAAMVKYTGKEYPLQSMEDTHSKGLQDDLWSEFDDNLASQDFDNESHATPGVAAGGTL